MDLTRRRFLTRVAAAGGASLAYEAMTGLGLLAAPAQTPFDLTGRVSGVRVVILGAGLAGMTVAYELGKVGYDCRVLEARARPGGRVFTVRRGTVSEEDGPSQTAAFDDGLYFNAGPMRISHHHHTTLAYCRELQVPTEVFVPDCESAYLSQTRGPLAGRRIRLREARADFDGYIAELLSKALSQAQLDQPLTAEDRDRVLAYLRRLGALDQQRQYRGSSRRGPDDQGRPSAPLALRDLFGGIPDFYVQTDWFSQPTMMQVAGGMDRLPAALAARLGNRIVYRAAVREIRQSERGVWVIYADANGRPQRVDADYCVSTIPLPVLSDIQKDLSQPVQSAIAAAQLRRRRQDRPAVQAPVLGTGRRDLRRPIVDRPGDRTDHLPVTRLQRRAKGCSSVTTWISAGPCASVLPPNVSGWRSSRAPASTRSTRPSSRRRSPSRGRACHGAAAHGGRNRPRRMKRSRRSANPTAGCTSPAIT